MCGDRPAKSALSLGLGLIGICVNISTPCFGMETGEYWRMTDIDLEFIRCPSSSVLDEKGITMLCKKESGGTDAATMAHPLEAEARACCPCGITRTTCLVQAFSTPSLIKCVPVLLPLIFLYTARRALAGIPSRRCLHRIHEFANVGQKAGSSGVDKNSIRTPRRPGFFLEPKGIASCC